MRADQASGAYLGGIGSMLEVSDVCPTCGEAHSERQYSILHRGSGRCPRVEEGAYAVTSQPPVAIDAHLVPQLDGEEGGEIPISMGSLPFPPREPEVERRVRTLSLPWLSPPDLGGVF